MSIAAKPDLWDLWEKAQAPVALASEPEKPAMQEEEKAPPKPPSIPAEEAARHHDLRHSRRRQIRSNAEVIDWHSVQVNPDIAQVVDASSDGILFDTEREYRVGMELMVRFPYPCATSPKQTGKVVRVEEKDGHQLVAVRFG